MATKPKTLEELKAEVETLKENLNNPAITGNPMMLGNLKKRIEDKEKKIHEMEKTTPEKQPAKKAVTKAAPAKKEAPAKKVKEPIAKTPKAEKKAADQKPKMEVATTLTKKEIQELKESPKIAKILSSEYKKHRMHFELSKVGLSKSEISALTGATTSNIGRDLLFYKVGKLSVD